jgi:hypothetical protein
MGNNMKKNGIIILFIIFCFPLFSQTVSSSFQIKNTNTNNSIVEISNESLEKLKNLGFDFSINRSYLSRNFSEHFDFNKDGFNDIVWVVPKNPSIGSPVLIFLWDNVKKKFIENSKFFILAHGDHMFYFDTINDFDSDGDLDIYIPIENYHGQPGLQPSYYLPGGNFVPGNFLINDGNSLSRIYIDSTTVNTGKIDYPAYWQASLIDYDQDNKKDLIVPTINLRPDSNGYLAASYSIEKDRKITRKFVFPWASSEMYRGQTHSMMFRNFNDKIYAFLQTNELYPDGINTNYYYSYPEVWIYNKSVNNDPPKLLEKIELKRNLNLLNQGQLMNHDSFYISDLNKDGQEEYILGMFSLPLTKEHWAIHIFDKNGKEITDKWFSNKEFLESTGAHANGYDLIDLNGDGFEDILPRDRFNCDDNQIPIFLNNGKKFERYVIPTGGAKGFNLSVDSNNDGVREILKVNDQDEIPQKAVTLFNLTYAPNIDTDLDGVVDLFDKCSNTRLNEKVDENGCPFILSIMEDKSIGFMPNPFANLTKMAFPEEFGLSANIKIEDMAGIIQFKKDFVNNGEIIDLSNLPSGTYLLYLKSNYNSNSRIIKISKIQ